MASGKVQSEGVLLFEQPFVKARRYSKRDYMNLTTKQVPFENYRKVFRTSQRTVEKEFGGVQSLAKQAASTTSSDDALASLDMMLGRIQGLKRKVSLCIQSVWKALNWNSSPNCIAQQDPRRRQ